MPLILHPQNTQPDGDEVSDSRRPNAQLWLFRWLVFGLLSTGFLASIVAIIFTQNPLLVSIPAAILFTLRPIIRWIYR